MEYSKLTTHLVGKNNRRCLCASCERKGIGGYIIESDWSLHSSETDGEGGNVQQANNLQPGMTKKRRSELDNLKENLTDLMKAPILPVGASDDSDTAEKDRDREREKRREKRKEKGKKKRDKQSDPVPISSTIAAKEKVISKDGSTSTVAGKVAQLPTPSTTHSYASTSGGTPKQDIHDDEHDAEADIVAKQKRKDQGNQPLLTPPPSNNSGDEDVDGSDDDAQSARTNQARKPPSQPAKVEVPPAPVKRGRGRPRKNPLPVPVPVRSKPNESGSDEAKEGKRSAHDDSSSDDDDDSSESTSSDEEQRRVYAFRQRKLKEGPGAQASGNSRFARRATGGGGGGAGTPTSGAPGRSGGATNAGKQGKVCITCKRNELTTKNELTCGRFV